MAFIPAINTIWAVLQYTDPELTLANNNLYFESNHGAVTDDDLVSMAQAINTWWQGSLAIWLSNELNLFVVSAIDLTADDLHLHFEINPSTVVGHGGPMIPLLCGYRIYFKTGVPGRSFRGLNTVPGLPEDVVALSQVDNTVTGGIQSSYNLLFDLAASLGYTWVVCSRHAGGADRLAAVNTPVTLTERKNNLVSSWRQRAPGRHTP